MELKERLKQELASASDYLIAKCVDIDNIRNGLIAKECFKPIVKVETLESIASAYYDLTIVLNEAINEIEKNEGA